MSSRNKRDKKEESKKIEQDSEDYVEFVDSPSKDDSNIIDHTYDQLVSL